MVFTSIKSVLNFQNFLPADKVIWLALYLASNLISMFVHNFIEME